MPTESQNIEFKESWRDEYQKWICGFANAQGGTLYIGMRDNGEVCAVQDAKKLMEDIPNKVRDMMGILVDVNLKEKDGKPYLKIVTEAYPYPISFRGKYYQRSGATNQELKGAALDRFMLRKQVKRWDGVPVPYLKVEDLDNATFDLFRKYAKRSGRMEDEDLMDNNHGLLEKLRLYEGSYLKRAAALLFHPDPEKYVTGAFVKVGFFREGMDLVYQDEVHGNLFQQIVKLMDLLCTKYMKAIITYEGIQRIETLPMPREALREALLNACINKDYAEPSPIQIRVYENKLEIINGECCPKGGRWKPYCLHIGVCLTTRILPIRSFVPVRLRHGDAALSVLLWLVRMTDSLHRSSAMMLRVYGRLLSLSTRKGRQSKATQNRPRKQPGNARNRSTKQEDAILELIKDNPYIQRKEMVNRLGIHESSVKRRLASLQERGIIKHIGPNKGGYWKLINVD